MAIAGGTRLGPYEVVAPLGAGGMGEVYRALDTRLGRDVALKVLRADFAADHDLLRRFDQEARSIASLSHPGVCTLYDVGHAAGVHFLVMELLTGETLAQRLSRGRLPVEEALRVAREVATALAAAHRRALVHRDLKPGNVMLAETGAKLLDFGLAKLLSGTPGEGAAQAATLVETGPGVVLGTVAYMSPEQLQGCAVDQRSDVFSFGVMLFEMLAGHRPFPGATAAQLAAAVLRDEPEALPPGVGAPPWLAAVVSRCLRQTPGERFATGGDLAGALAAGASRAPGTAPEAPPAAAPRRAGGSRTVLVLDFANLAGDAAAAWLSTGIAETVAVDLKKLASVTVAGRERLAAELAGREPSSLSRAELLRFGGLVEAELVISGAFQKLGESVRLTASVLDVAGGEAIAAVKLDGSMSELFSLQDALVAELLAALGVVVSESRKERRELLAPPRLAAYELYARGRQLHNQLGRAGMEQARGLYEQAIALDPHYALAYSGLGGLSMMRYIATTNRSDLDVGIVYLQRAAELDAELADPHLWLTYGLARLGRFGEAHREGGQAVALEPTNPMAHYFAGVAHWLEGMERFAPGRWRDAAQRLREAADLAPAYQAASQLLGDVLLRTGDHAGAADALRRAGEIERSGRHTYARFVGAFSLLGRVLQRSEGWQSALAAYDTSLQVLAGVDHVYVPAGIALAHLGAGEAYLRAGRIDEALRAYRQAQEVCRKAERALGIGWMAVRAEIGTATASHLLGMRREERAAAESAASLLERQGPFDYSGIMDGGTAVVCHDWARHHAASGRRDEALQWLERAVEAGWRDPGWLSADEQLKPLRGDPAFTRLVAAAGARE